MMSALVVVDTDRIRAVADLLGRIEVPPDAEEVSLDCQLPQPVLPDLYLVLVAICHQTSPLNEPPLAGVLEGERFAGWDYLRAAFLMSAQRDARFLAPTRLAGFSATELNAILQIAQEPVHLNDLPGRAALIRDIGERMVALGLTSVANIFVRCNGILVRADGPGLLEELGRFRAYRDPVRKKSSFFLSLMQNMGLWKYSDSHNLPAPVDYHEVRGHLRCGTVKIVGQELAQRVRDGDQVSEAEDEAIRSAVSEAISAIGVTAGVTSSRLHYLFWNVFRACCKRDETHCYACPTNCGLPDRYKALTAARRRCLFSDVCLSRDRDQKLIEHRTVTDFY